MNSTQVRISVPEGIEAGLITGPQDRLIRALEKRARVEITVRGSSLSISGPTRSCEALVKLFEHLFELIAAGDTPNIEDSVRLLDSLLKRGGDASGIAKDVILTYRGKCIRPKTVGQKRYIEAIRSHAMTFCIGPAGTGKTYLAMAMAIAALQRHDVGRIVLTRPVVEAGENLGFLPGTLEDKVDPYVRPLFDALLDMMDSERASQLVDRGVIEIAPLAYMRGRTLNDAFVILDEAQNTTPEQMKMFLTRLGFNSTFVITGDASQRDLIGRPDGLSHIQDILGGVEQISFIHLDSEDVVRHSLVGRIVEAYDMYDQKRAAQGGRHGRGSAHGCAHQ